MAYKNIYASIEIGTYSIKLVVGEMVGTKINLFNALESYYENWDIDLTNRYDEISSIIKNLIEQTNQLLGFSINKVLLTIPSDDFRYYEASGYTKVGEQRSVIDRTHIRNVINDAACALDSQEELVVNVLAKKFAITGSGYVNNPLGLFGNQLEVEAQLLTAPMEKILFYIKCVERCGVEIIDIIGANLAASYEILHEDERKDGAIIIDMGHNSTTATLFKNDIIQDTITIPFGGRDVINDISYVFRINENKAKELKQKYASLIGQDLEDAIVFKYREYEDGPIIEVSQENISEVAYYRLKEIIEMIKEKIKEMQGNENYNIYVIGGNSEYKGLSEYLTTELESQVRVYIPSVIGARLQAMVGPLGAMHYYQDKCMQRGIKDSSIDQQEFEESIKLKMKSNMIFNANTNDMTFIEKLVKTIFSENKKEEEL